MTPAIPTGAAGQAAQQTLENSGTVSGGTWTIGPLDGMTTAALPFNSTGKEIAAAINAAFGLPANTEVTCTAATEAQAVNSSKVVLNIPPNLINALKGNTALTIGNGSITGGGSIVAKVTQEGILGGNELQGSGQAPSEVPHIVGGAGQPAYENSIESPVGKSVTIKFPSAAPADANLQPAQFYLDQDGFVHLEGVAVPSGAVAAGKAIFTLPETYRPFQDEDLGAILVKTNGEVVITTAVAATGEAIDIAGSFRASGV